MFTKLVVPLDGSELAASALPYAISMAAFTHAELLLVRVASAPAPMTVDGSNWERQQIEGVEEAETYLATFATTITPGVPVKTCVPYGRATRELLDAIRLSHADGVVMATHGRTGIRHLLYGSVAEGLLAKSPVPVMLVHTRSGEAPPALFDSTSAHVAVPLNGSSLAETALDPAVDLVGSRGELILVCVVEPPTRVERDDTGHVIAYLDQQEEAEHGRREAICPMWPENSSSSDQDSG